MAAAGAVVGGLRAAPQSMCHMCRSNNTASKVQQFAAFPVSQKQGALDKKEYLSGGRELLQEGFLVRQPVERMRGAARAAVAVASERGAMSKVEKWGGEKRLQTQTAPIAQDTTTIRSLDWDRDRFDM